MRSIVEKYCELPTGVRRPLWQLWHRIIISFDKEKAALFMNYGFQDHDEQVQVKLKPDDKNDRYCTGSCVIRHFDDEHSGLRY